jgi:general nucleoside transport system ATP-binding protein
VLLVSEELEEILALSDRVVALYGGVIVGELASDEASVEKIGRLMLGQKAA